MVVDIILRYFALISSALLLSVIPAVLLSFSQGYLPQSVAKCSSYQFEAVMTTFSRAKVFCSYCLHLNENKLHVTCYMIASVKSKSLPLKMAAFVTENK